MDTPLLIFAVGLCCRTFISEKLCDWAKCVAGRLKHFWKLGCCRLSPSHSPSYGLTSGACWNSSFDFHCFTINSSGSEFCDTLCLDVFWFICSCQWGSSVQRAKLSGLAKLPVVAEGRKRPWRCMFNVHSLRLACLLVLDSVQDNNLDSQQGVASRESILLSSYSCSLIWLLLATLAFAACPLFLGFGPKEQTRIQVQDFKRRLSLVYTRYSE